MRVTMNDIRKRKEFSSPYMMNEMNINKISYMTEDGKLKPNTAKYLIDNWRSFDEDSNIAFESALLVFHYICENGDINAIEYAFNVLYEGVQKVRDANQLMNSIKWRTSRFKSKISTKINTAINNIGMANNNVTAKIKAALEPKTPSAGGVIPSPPSAGSGGGSNNNNTDDKVEECFNALYEKAKMIYECDRILRNSTKLGIDDMIKSASDNFKSNPDERYQICKICKEVANYCKDFKVAYNTALETVFYVFGSSYNKIDPKNIIESVTLFFVFNNDTMSFNEEDVKFVSKHNVIFEESDFECVLGKPSFSTTKALDSIIVKEAVSNYGVDDIILEGPIKDKVKEWSKGNPEERENDDVKKMINDFRDQCKDKEPPNNTVQLKTIVNKIFTKTPKQITTELPNLLSIIRYFFIIGSCAINPVLGLITFITDQIIKIELERKNIEKIIENYKTEINKTKETIEKSKSNEEKDRLERYKKELEKDLEKLKDYQRAQWSEEENDEREFNSDDYEFDDDEWDFGDDDWDEDWGDLELEQADIINAASIIRISEAVEKINECLTDKDLDGVIFSNIYKMDDETIDAVSNFAITVPSVLDKVILCKTLENYREDLREEDFRSNVLRIDCINRNIRKLKEPNTYEDTAKDIKTIICTLDWLAEAVTIGNSEYIMEMDLSNSIKLAMNRLKKQAVKLSDKEKQLSKTIDMSMSSLSKGLENALRNDNREAIIRGTILPSASKTIKIALITGATWAVSPAVAVIGAVGAFACSKRLKAKERQLVLDDIEIELKMCERYLRQAEDKNDMKAIRQIEVTQRNLERQRQRIKYKMHVIYNQNTPEVGDDE